MAKKRSLFLVLSGLNQACSSQPAILTLATTTSTENSGLLAAIHPDFEASAGMQVKLIAKGTGAALRLARGGDADAVLVHAPQLEAQFVEEGWGLSRHAVMYNDFVLIGPDDDPAGIAQAPDAAGALLGLAQAEALFVSRGDASGTHIKEQRLWERSGIALEVRDDSSGAPGSRPTGDWYHSIGQGMGKAILYATERRGYTLCDRGTYYAFALDEPARTDLRILHQGDPVLANPYHVIAVDPQRHPHVQAEAAQAYVRWITSPRAQDAIGAYRVHGETLFHPGPAP